MEQKLWFTNSKGDRLCGVLSDPAKDKRFVVILCHGRGSNKDSKTNIGLQNKLNTKNISTFRFDFYGHGESAGKFEDMTVSELVDDILNAIKFLRVQRYKKFGVVGSSFGGVAATMAATKSKDILFLAFKCPGMGQHSRHMPLICKDFQNKVWIKAAKEVKVPTLIVWGDKDEEVEPWQVMELAKAIKNSRLEIIKGADHKYTNPKDFQKAMKLIVDFVVKHVK